MKKPLAAFVLLLAVLGVAPHAIAEEVSGKSFSFTQNIPALGPSNTLASLAVCDEDAANSDPNTLPDEEGCVRKDVSADTDAVLTVKVETKSSEVTSTPLTTSTNPEICGLNEVGVRMVLTGVVGAATFNAVYDESPNASGGEKSVPLSVPGASRNPHVTICV